MSTRVTGASAASPPNAQGPASSNPNAAARFRAALDRSKSQPKSDERSKPAGRASSKDKAATTQGAPLEALTGMVITPMGIASGPDHLASRLPASAALSASAGAKAQRASEVEALIEQQDSAESLAITDVRVGRGGGAVRVHATLAQGEHQGVELRAVEKNGRIEVELRAADSAAAERLRSEVGALRDSLESQGIERVAVAVVDASRSAAGSHGFSQGDSQRRGEGDEASDEASEARRGASNPAGATRSGARRGDPEGDEESGDARDLLL